MLTDNPLLQVVLFTILQSPGVGSVALNTITVEIYPTRLRSMAICIALMVRTEKCFLDLLLHSTPTVTFDSFQFGRLGSVAGSNMVAYLLEENCEFTFYLCGSTLIGEIRFFACVFPNVF